MKHCIVLGTRPEIIKMSSTIRALQQRGDDFFVLHTNQHYSEAMDAVFFRELALPAARYNLGVGSGSHGVQTAAMLKGIEPILQREQPGVVYVQGDTNTVVAGALAASKLNIPVAHVEAGLRSYDRLMPEETNRIIADHVATLLFAPTESAANILQREGLPTEHIHVVGNPIVDAVLQSLPLAEQQYQNTLPDLGLKSENYILVTMHRPANVDDPAVLKGLLSAIDQVAQQLKLSALLPLHPRTKASLEQHQLILPSSIRQIEPCGFLQMLQLEQHAALIMTDSGGVQEEACILKRRCITLRENTERPETVTVGGNILGGISPATILPAAQTMLQRRITWSNPFGDGTTGEQMIRIAEEMPQS